MSQLGPEQDAILARIHAQAMAVWEAIRPASGAPLDRGVFRFEYTPSRSMRFTLVFDAGDASYEPIVPELHAGPLYSRGMEMAALSVAQRGEKLKAFDVGFGPEGVRDCAIAWPA